MTERKSRTRLCVLSLVALAAMVPGQIAAQPRPSLWERWAPCDSSSTASVDHSAWDTPLAQYIVSGSSGGVLGVNLFDYAGVTTAGRRLLDAYLSRLQRVPVTLLNREEQRAYWINLYNALTVNVILDHYPVESIRKINISPGWFTAGPWMAQLSEIEVEAVTLDDIEHRILRPIWADPRIHYAVNCASLSCPNLRPIAFTATNSEELLERGAREYINHPRGAEIDGNTLRLSSIYQWFDEDFGGNRTGVLEHLRIFAAPTLRERLGAFTGRIAYRYDWSLNDVER